jgi:hypothetical protein
MTNSTEVVAYAAEPLATRIQYAETLARASLIPKALWTGNYNDDQGRLVPSRPSVGNVLLVMEHGAMLGLHPMAAINGIFIIEGKASMSSNLMAAVVRGEGFVLRVVTDGEWGEAFKAVATLVRPDDKEFTYRVEWTMARAKRADLLGKDNWKKYPEAMAKARAISEVIREGASDALNGIGYTPEELGANVTESGDVIEGEFDDEPAAPSATPPAAKRATNGRQGTKRAKAAPVEPEAVTEPPAAEPDSNIVDAEVIEDDKPATVDPDSIDRADEDAVRAYNETHGKASGHLITSDAERAKQAERIAGDASAKEATAKLVEQARADGAATRAKRAADEAAAQADEDAAKADAKTGEIPEDDGAAAAEEIKAKRAARGAPTAKAPSDEPEPWATQADEPEETPAINAYEVMVAAEPEAWAKHLEAATDVAQVKAVWDGASSNGAMTAELRMAVVKRKDEITKATA